MITHAPYLSLSFFQDFSLFCFFLHLPFSCFLSLTLLSLIVFILWIFTIHFSHHPSLPYYLHLIYVSFHYHYALYIFPSPVFTFLYSPYFCFYIPTLFCIHNLYPPSLHYCLHLIFISIHLMIHFPLAKNYVIQRCSCPSVPSLYFYSFFTSPVFRYLCLHLIDVSFHH